MLLEHSRPGLAAAWVQRYVTKCQHVLYTCVGAKYFGRRIHHGRWVFYINREHLFCQGFVQPLVYVTQLVYACHHAHAYEAHELASFFSFSCFFSLLA